LLQLASGCNSTVPSGGLVVGWVVEWVVA
jgi:hypothetical protein